MRCLQLTCDIDCGVNTETPSLSTGRADLSQLWKIKISHYQHALTLPHVVVGRIDSFEDSTSFRNQSSQRVDSGPLGAKMQCAGWSVVSLLFENHTMVAAAILLFETTEMLLLPVRDRQGGHCGFQDSRPQ